MVLEYRFRDPIVSSIGDMVLVQGSDCIKHRRHGTGSEIRLHQKHVKNVSKHIETHIKRTRTHIKRTRTHINEPERSKNEPERI